MKTFYSRFSRLILGLFLYALGIVITLNAHIGYAPWEVFHVGFAKSTGMSIGMASIVAGVVIGVLSLFLGEKLGLGTLLNMVLIGVFLDLILNYRFIPTATHFAFGIPMLIVGLFVISLASYFYIGSGFGAGPRDSLMVALTRKTKLPIGLCRGIIELLAVLAGWQLGGMFGIGTVISALSIGFCVQLTFKLLKFDTTKIKHETLSVTYKTLFGTKSI